MKLLKFILSLFLSSSKRKKIDLSGYEARMDKGFHAWNKADGYYYDVTWYDTYPRQSKYLHSKTGWGRVCRLNDKGVRQKRG